MDAYLMINDIDKITVTAPRSRNIERYIDVTITDNIAGGTFNFSAAPVDSMAYCVEIYQRTLAGDYGVVSVCPDDGNYYEWDGSGWVLARTHAELEQEADEHKKANLLTLAAEAIAPLQDAVDLAMATEREKELITAWKKYRVLLMRVDIAQSPDIIWPVVPE
ncbi:TPA: tail fiber assembly protein [Yersinia enterocolitica]|nr:tail fiber assembly protein [Yersinia enterocolitica]HDL8539177.1 tail fiber assembly protein [Yersinia enterocolitica]HEN3347832.1 tail fiber assembly protein [Yersinia enterocolitica]